MNISVAWMADHLDVHIQNLNMPDLVAHIIQKVAEVEQWRSITLNADDFELFQVFASDDTGVTVGRGAVSSMLPVRTDLVPGAWVLLVRDAQNEYRYCTYRDVGGVRDLLMPPLTVRADEWETGAWKKHLETTDYILEVDNKSLTHRPDMWGHRGFAREIAALLNVPLKPLSLATGTCLEREEGTLETSGLSLSIQDTRACKRLSAVAAHGITNKPSDVWMAIRLARIDSKPINALVDISNYVMFDIGQPLHVFDKRLLPHHLLTVRMAHAGEALTLLDHTSINLTDNDLVVASGAVPVSLAGVMGGDATAVSLSTTDIVLEAGSFDPARVRKSSVYHKRRTEASLRFEKSIDPSGTTTALWRFLAICERIDMVGTVGTMLTVGTVPVAPTITIGHERIEQLLGCAVEPSLVVRVLSVLDFVVSEKQPGVYHIQVPTYRATKDIAYAEDIIEEIGRSIGYDSIHPILPALHCLPTTNSALEKKRAIKKRLVAQHGLRELALYSFYDEVWLKKIDCSVDHYLEIINPRSEHAKRLVTSLIPHLLKAVESQGVVEGDVRFFEWARTWKLTGTTIDEREVIAGVLFGKQIDFYSAQSVVYHIGQEVGCELVFEQIKYPHERWWKPYQTAAVLLNKEVIGVVGMMTDAISALLGEGNAVCFELYTAPLTAVPSVNKRYVPVSKYPAVSRDLSILVPLLYTSARIKDAIMSADRRICEVVLVDFFTKPEWVGQRSLLYRCTLVSDEGTMTKDVIDGIMGAILEKIAPLGVTVR